MTMSSVPRPDETEPQSPSLATDPDKAAMATEVLKAVGHPIRLRIVAALCRDEELCVSALAARMEVAQPVISQQLRILRNRELVSVSRRNGFAYYRIEQPLLRKLIRCMEGCDASRSR